MSRHNAGEQAVSYQRLFPCPPCRPMIRNDKVFTQSLSLENYIKSTGILHEQSENKVLYINLRLNSLKIEIDSSYFECYNRGNICKQRGGDTS